MRRVLLIDDQETVALVLKPVFEKAGLEFDRLEKFVELPRLLLRNPPSLIILDLTMPSLNGVKMGDLIRRRCPSMPIIVYSSRNREERESAAQKIGANAHLSKSAPKSELVSLALELVECRAA